MSLVLCSLSPLGTYWWPCQDTISRFVCRTSHTLTVMSRLQEASHVPLRFQDTWGAGEGGWFEDEGCCTDCTYLLWRDTWWAGEG